MPPSTFDVNWLQASPATVSRRIIGLLAGIYTRPSQQRHFEWSWVTLSDLAKNSMIRRLPNLTARPICVNFFSYKVINRWNSLPEEAIQADSINSFKKHLQKIYSTRMGFFLDWTSDSPRRRLLEPDFRIHVRPHLVSYLVSYEASRGLSTTAEFLVHWAMAI